MPMSGAGTLGKGSMDSLPPPRRIGWSRTNIVAVTVLQPLPCFMSGGPVDCYSGYSAEERPHSTGKPPRLAQRYLPQRSPR